MSHIDYMVALFLSMATGLIAGYGFGWIFSEMRHDREEFRRLMREAKVPDPHQRRKPVTMQIGRDNQGDVIVRQGGPAMMGDCAESRLAAELATERAERQRLAGAIGCALSEIYAGGTISVTALENILKIPQEPKP